MYKSAGKKSYRIVESVILKVVAQVREGLVGEVREGLVLGDDEIKM